MSTPPAAVNADQVRYWNEVAGPTWVVWKQAIDEQIRPLGEHVMDRSGLAPGERVIDLGCGCGDSTLELARRTGREGRVVGIDLSAPMLGTARQQAASAGLRNVVFGVADAQVWKPKEEGFDLVFSRFGVMFFEDPQAAFDNVAGWLRPGGRLAFVCWQRVQDNPWMFVPMMAAAAHVTFPPPNPDAPGPFSFADPEKIRRILAAAGFVDVGLEDHRRTLAVGGTAPLEKAVEFLLQMGPTGRVLREANDPALADRVAKSIREALEPHRTDAGVRLDSASWIVTARRPPAAG